jgi:hypothetical protein
MTDNISVTRIVDLPEGPYMGAGSFSTQSNTKESIGGSGFSNTYLPIDVHPNPYGMPPPPPGGILPPDNTEGDSYDKYIPESHQRLPQRDIPMNISEHTQDEYTQPNFIPPVNKPDYIKEYQVSQDRQIREYEEKKMREKVRENWLEQLQWPILVGLIFFVFQLPIINTIVFKRFSFLSIYKDDGNFNLLGLGIKSILFIFIYVSVQKSLEFMGEL